MAYVESSVKAWRKMARNEATKERKLAMAVISEYVSPAARRKKIGVSEKPGDQ
jgi:hypothetical protein